MHDPASELRRILLPKLFGNSQWIPNRGSESGQEGSKESRSAASWRHRRVLEMPSAIFQTVSPRTRVNKGKRKGRDPAGPRPFSLSSVSLLASQLLLGLIHQPFLFPLLFCCCCGFLLAWLGHGANLLHRPKQIILGPLLNKLATLVKAVYLDARHLDTLATARDSEELSLVGSAGLPAADDLISFCYLVLHGVGEVGDGITEVLYLPLYGVCSPNLSSLGIGVPADEVRVEHLVHDLNFTLTEGLLQYTTHLFLVLFRHIEVSFRLCCCL